MEMKDSREQNTSNRHSEKLCVDVCVSHICPTAVARCLRLQRPHQSSSIHRISPVSDKVTCCVMWPPPFYKLLRRFRWRFCSIRRQMFSPHEPEMKSNQSLLEPKVTDDTVFLMIFVIIQKTFLHFHSTAQHVYSTVFQLYVRGSWI